MAGNKGLNQGITEAKPKGSLSPNHMIDTAQWYSASLASSRLWIHSPGERGERDRKREGGRREELEPASDQLEEQSITIELVWSFECNWSPQSHKEGHY